MRCTVDDEECCAGRLKRGMCELHYRRWRTTGTTASPRLNPFTQYEIAEKGCWMWTGARWRNGYGKPSRKIHGTRLAHRMFYIEHVGPIPDGLDIDHRCHNADTTCERGPCCQHRLCVNPEHLEPASRSANLRRGIEAQPLCENGLHDLTLPDAVKPGTRQCVECWRIRYRAAAGRYRAKRLKA